MDNIQFEKRKSIEQVEESNELAPKFDSNGLIPVVTTDFSSGELLMQGYMNEEAFKKTISLLEAVYFYRSIPLDNSSSKVVLKFEEKEKVFDPEEVYKGVPNPTKL